MNRRGRLKFNCKGWAIVSVLFGMLLMYVLMSWETAPPGVPPDPPVESSKPDPKPKEKPCLASRYLSS